MAHRIAIAIASFGLALGIPGIAVAQTNIDQTTTTAHYRFELVVGPMETMLTPDQAATATDGEIMLGMVGSMPSDQGMMNIPMPADQGVAGMNMGMGGNPMTNGNMGVGDDPMANGNMGGMGMGDTARSGANTHHVEIHVYDSVTGAAVPDIAPAIVLTNQATGATTTLDQVMVMYGLAEGMDDIHYGNNINLASGSYTVTAAIGDDVATFPDIQID